MKIFILKNLNKKLLINWINNLKMTTLDLKMIIGHNFDDEYMVSKYYLDLIPKESLEYMEKDYLHAWSYIIWILRQFNVPDDIGHIIFEKLCSEQIYNYHVDMLYTYNILSLPTKSDHISFKTNGLLIETLTKSLLDHRDHVYSLTWDYKSVDAVKISRIAAEDDTGRILWYCPKLLKIDYYDDKDNLQILRHHINIRLERNRKIRNGFSESDSDSDSDDEDNFSDDHNDVSDDEN